MEGLYYPYSENKGADQLRGYREADLRLCFRICKTLFFSRSGSNSKKLIVPKKKMPPKNANRTTNCANPDQTALFALDGKCCQS